MKILVYILSLVLFTIPVKAQTYSIGYRQVSFVDSARSNRSITADVYYPSNTTGTNVALATGQFPVLAFGHGFVMSVSAYKSYSDSIVPKGYIIILPTTESSFSPSHLNFGKDLAFLIKKLRMENLNSSSSFFNGVASTSCVMGHSMGGGSSFLAMNEDTTITAFVTMAAAETNPSAITAATNINKPALIFSATNDCVTPPAQHQTLMYNALASNCKTLVNIDGASHCQFAGFSTTCSFGESTCLPPPSITSTEQMTITFNLLIPWLSFYLKNDCNAGTYFQNAIANNTQVNVQQNCTLSCISTSTSTIVESKQIQLYPSPTDNFINIKINNNLENRVLLITDVQGKTLNKINTINNNNTISISTTNFAQGLYFVYFLENNIVLDKAKFIVEH